MDDEQKNTVCIIGAGVSGLVTAKVLQRDGFDVTLFEKEPTIGGVWAPSRAYAGLRTNNPEKAYAFSNLRYPETSDEFPTAGQVFTANSDLFEGQVGLLSGEGRIEIVSEVVKLFRAGEPHYRGDSTFISGEFETDRGAVHEGMND